MVMTGVFSYEKLDVYRKGIRFTAIRDGLLAGLARRVAACDHLVRGAESIPVNIAHASSSWSPKERIECLGYANGSALECAACLDIFVAKDLLTPEDVRPGKSLLAEIVSILIRMKETTADRVREEPPFYRTKKGNLFSHEDLDVYQAELRLVGWMEGMTSKFVCSADLLSKLDKATTSIVLNTAEGNGRFTGKDHAKFLGIAYKATVQSSSLIDLATAGSSEDPSRVEEGRELLRRIASLLTSLANARQKDSRT
jgi:four helix bundle protein